MIQTQASQKFQKVTAHRHNGVDSFQIHPKDLLNLQLFTTFPGVKKAPSFFLYSSGGTTQFCFKVGQAVYRINVDTVTS